MGAEWADSERLTLKDLDWKDVMTTPLLVQQAEYTELSCSLRSDVNILKELGVVDFSLLIGFYVIDVDTSRLLPPPPSALTPGGQAADVALLRVSADAAALVATYQSKQKQWSVLQQQVNTGSTGVADSSTAANDTTTSTTTATTNHDGDNGHGVRWVNASAVVRRRQEERVVTLVVSCAIVDVLSCAEANSNPSKFLESRVNHAFFDTASVVRPAEYSQRFLRFAEAEVFACIE